MRTTSQLDRPAAAILKLPTIRIPRRQIYQ
jgi:hypothetical protein